MNAIKLTELPVPATYAESIQHSIRTYKRMGIDIAFIDQTTVKITQSRLINGYILNNKELYDRAKEVLEGAGNFKIVPVVFQLDIDSITPAWIERKMEELGISRNDLVRQLALDKATLSLYFSSGRGLTRTAKAAFFYYFLTYELNRDFRDNESQ